MRNEVEKFILNEMFRYSKSKLLKLFLIGVLPNQHDIHTDDQDAHWFYKILKPYTRLHMQQCFTKHKAAFDKLVNNFIETYDVISQYKYVVFLEYPYSLCDIDFWCKDNLKEDYYIDGEYVSWYIHDKQLIMIPEEIVRLQNNDDLALFKLKFPVSKYIEANWKIV